MAADPLVVLQNAAMAAGATYLAAMFAGPKASIAVAALGHGLIGDAQASPDYLASEVQAGGPDLNLRMKETEQMCLSRLDQAEEAFKPAMFFPVPARLSATDARSIEDARERQVKLHDATNQWLDYGVSIGFLALILALVSFPFRQTDAGIKDLLFTLLGVVATGLANITGYYFGSSAGPVQKSQTLTATLDQTLKNQAA